MIEVWREKLQAVAADADEDVSPALIQACKMALDALAAQAAEIERLTRERDEARKGQHAANKYEPTWAELVCVWRTRATAAEAEAERLRAALAFLRPSQWEQSDICGITFDARWLAEHIDAALGQKP